MLAGVPASLSAQEAPAVINVTPPPGGDQLVEFSADSVAYDGEADVVTASGAVRMSREGNYVAADNVVWTRKTGEVRAVGNVVLMTPEGDKLVGDNVVLTDTLRDGTIDNLLVALEQGGRIAARRGVRRGDTTILEHAIYSPCPVTTTVTRPPPAVPVTSASASSACACATCCCIFCACFMICCMFGCPPGRIALLLLNGG